MIPLAPIGDMATASLSAGDGYELPDSVIHRWKLDEGSGSTAADSIGDADGTINGASWTTGTWVGDTALDHDGANDSVDTGANAGLTGQIVVAATVVFGSFPGSGDVGHIGSGGYDGMNTAWEMRIDGRSGNERIGIGSYDGSGHRVAGPSFSELSTGTKYRFVGQYTGSAWEFWTNGSRNNSSSDGTGAVSSSANRVWAAHDNDGSIGSFGDVVLDDLIIANGAWSDQEIQDDYDRQPWS